VTSRQRPHANGSAVRLHDDLGGLLFSPKDASCQLYGYCDGVHGRCVDGWVFDAASPSSKLAVEVYDGSRLLGSAKAELFRADLDAIGIADGHHAFRFELPYAIFDGEEHEIEVRVANSGVTVPGSPLILATGPLNGVVMPRRASPTLPARDDAVLRSLHAITEMLLVQTRLLHTLVASQPPPNPGAQPAAESPANPWLAAALTRPVGAHDYILFAIIDWSFRVQRPQHLAMRLAAMGNRVFYVSVRFAELVAGASRFTVTGEPADGVFEITLSCRPPVPIIYNGIGVPEQSGELAEAVRSLASTLQLQRPVCLLNLPSWYPVAQAIPGASIIFDCLDHLPGFSNVAPCVIELERELIESADGVVVTSQFLRDTVAQYRSPDIIRNGVDVPYFSRPPGTPYEPAARPLIGYYGAISEWFDIQLVMHCARRHPKWHFVLIGAVDCCNISEAVQLRNVTFLGEKPYAELTRYLYAFDVCLIPFKLTDLTRATNPVKVYEYLCAGKPVVATDLPELRRLPPNLVRLAGSPSTFEKAIADCLRANDATASRQRQLWAAKHSWDSRVRKLTGVVARNYPPVSVVVLCHNNLTFTTACLDSLLAFSDYPELEIICVDNASTDGTRKHLEGVTRQHSSVRTLRNQSNLGFAAGNNVGIRAARGAFVILLNNDTYVTRGWVRDLIRPMQRHHDIGMTGPLTNMAGNEQKIAITYSNMPEMAQASAAFTASRRRMQYPTGNLAFFCVAIRRGVFDTVGELDESYGIGYFEDDDYCRRVQKAGYRLVICDDVFVHHHHSASFDQLGDLQKAALMRRNRRKYEKRWGRWTPHAYRIATGFGDG
jgi:GT2 family glycosyltransferase/glycosyltransferase involved in cell wall biosynthesis